MTVPRRRTPPAPAAVESTPSSLCAMLEADALVEGCGTAPPFNEYRRLDETPNLPGFSVDWLPCELAGFVSEVAETVQCPVDLPAVAALTACATAVQRVAMVAVGDTHREPLNLWAISAAEPSERKSETFGKVFAPVYAKQSEIEREMKPEVDAAEQRFKLQQGRIAALEKRHRAAIGEQLEQLESEITRARQALQEPPSIPRLTASDVTPETLATILFHNAGRLSVIDAEGAGPIANAFGRYSNAPKLENLLRAYRGDTMQIDRQGRHETIFAPCLTLALALQPGVLRHIGKHPEARAQGFAARFLYSIPNTRAGMRPYQNRRIDQTAADGYRNKLENLLWINAESTITEKPNFRELHLTGDGLEVWRNFHDTTESAMRQGGSLAEYRDFAGKLAGHAARIAGILAMIQSGARAIEQPIPAAIVDAACRMMREYFQPHGLAAYALMFEHGEDSLAARIVGWISRHRDKTEHFPIFTKANLYGGLRRSEDVNTSSDLDAPLAVLVDRGYIRKLFAQPTHGAGHPPSDRYEVNPAWCE